MRRVGYFTLGLVAAVALGARADQFPSRPIFQQMTVNGTVAGQTNTIACNTSNASGARCWVGRVGSTGSLTWTTATDAGAQQNDALALTRDSSGRFTGAIIDAPNTGNGLQINGAAGSNTILANGSSTAGQSFGIEAEAGTNSSDYALLVAPQSGASVFFKVDGAGNITAPGAASVPWQAPGTNGSAALTYSSGCAAGSSGASIAWQIVGKMASVRVTASSYCTTGTTGSIIFTGLPAALSSGMSGNRFVPCLGDTGTGVAQAAMCEFQTTGQFQVAASAGATLKSVLLTSTAAFPID